MGYKTNQFFGIEWAGEDPYYDPSVGASGYETSADNPSFLYPSREVRTNDHSGYKVTQLKRGYMRSLRTQADGIAVDVKKCQFQFNPSVLEQSVTQAEGLLNVFQSDPAQYAQPMPGNVAFGFTLMFDRTMEVNNKNRQANYLNSTNPWELSDPGEVGVLRDLATLYSVIGQGISSYQREYLQALLEKQAKREEVTLVADGTPTEETGYQEVVSKGIPAFLDMNVGNTAFLLPVPVRIVFSSLYIVEGYVASTSVVFTKFSTQMVPIQCAVTVNVDAKYIGFAQKDTFLTQSLAMEVQQREEALAADLESRTAISDAGAAAMGMARVSTVLLTNENTVETALTLQDFLFGLSLPARPRLKVASKPGVSQTPITDLFKSGAVTGSIVAGGVEVYGPFDNAVASLTEQRDIGSYVASRGIAALLDSRGMAGDGAMNSVASTQEEWTKSAAGAFGPPIAADYDRVDDSATKYYIVKYRAQVTLKGEQENPLATGDYYVVVPPGGAATHVLSRDVSLTWPSYGQASDGAVVRVGTQPTTSAPGASSSVGSVPQGAS